MGNICFQTQVNSQVELLASEDKEQEGDDAQQLTFKNLKAFKKVDNIHDKYALGKELGRGAFGVVYEAKAKGGKVTVAIKSLAKANVGDEELAQLMCNEIYVLQKTDHPNIVRVFELLEDSDNFYVVMELLSCGDLSKTIEK
jgi:calcium-dependent protein kinase